MTSSDNPTSKAGGCLCGAVRYRTTGPLRPLIACHCGQCRRMSGNFAVATAVSREGLVVDGADAITWFVASPGFRRGFCRTCGAHLFWDRDGAETVSIYAGSLDQPSGLRVVEHIYVDDKADFTLIDDGLPTRPRGG